MGSVNDLIDLAHRAGLSISSGPGKKLIIRGPRSADALARRLIADKQEVLRTICWPHGDFLKENTRHGERWTCGLCGRFYGYRPYIEQSCDKLVDDERERV